MVYNHGLTLYTSFYKKKLGAKYNNNNNIKDFTNKNLKQKTP